MYNIVMIYTCTVNPSLDYYLKVENEIKIGEVNRSFKEHYAAGGKGVNVSIVLNNLMIPSSALGFLGGFTKDFYLSFLNQYPYVQPRFTTIEGTTRINVKVNGKKETDLNTTGPHISDEEFNKFLKKCDRIDMDDTFILSGSIQKDLYDKMIELIERLSNNGVKIILDTNPKLMNDCLKYRPLLIKPNLDELEEMTDEIIQSEEKLHEVAMSLVDKGAMNVLVSLGSDGAILANKDGLYRANSILKDIVSTTGCGDAMVGAYVFNLQRGANDLEAFKYATAAGAATAFKEGLATREEIDSYCDEIHVERIK